MEIYDWEKKIIDHDGNVTIRGTRQGGKSVTVAKRIKRLAIDYPGRKHLIIAASDRQGNYLREKVMEEYGKKYKYRKRATLAHLAHRDGTDMFFFPVGQTGKYLEGMSSVDFLHADEAIHINPRVWDSILPMLAEPRNRGLGWITLLSSTQAKPRGFYYESFNKKNSERFLQVQVKADMCPHISKEFLDEEKERLPATYANFLITNDALIYPTYSDKNDTKAGEIFKEIFPAKEIIPINCLKLIEQGGSLHCSTMQIAY